MAQDEVVDPVVGDEADALALLLGGIGRATDALGTTVYVLAPDFEGAAPQQVLHQMGRAIMDYFWPKFIDGPEQTPTMSFSVRWQGSEFQLPKVQEEPELALLARAFTVASAKVPSGGAVLEPIASQRPKKLLGQLALARQPSALMGSSPAASESNDDGANLYQRTLRRPLRQIALMRAPNFVVKYLEGPLVPYELAEYGGVFRVDAEADAAFARAEPPTHDDWVPDLLLDAAEKTYVRVALRRVKDTVDAFTAPHPIEATGAGPHSVAGFSRLLGGLVPSLGSAASSPGSRANGSSNSNGEGGKRSGTGRTTTTAPQISFVGEPVIELVDGVASMVARFEASNSTGAAVRVFAQPKVVIADGFESNPPEGAQQPAVLKWIDSNGGVVAKGVASCDVLANSGTWAVIVSIPSDAMISVSLRVEAEAGA
ncbi:hypothetical protein WS87_13315 [Burkholderia sp. MSMB0856]|nr:hypothetical protein WS87_13315 [Burkholderia sp. MSMB0856]